MGKRIVITGASGLVGSRLLEIIGRTYPNILSPSRQVLDITNKTSVDGYISEQKPDVIIHAAAYTDNSKAEIERGDKNGECWKVNVEGTKNIVDAAKKVGAYVIFISTGSVLAGDVKNPGPFAEHDLHAPEERLSWYGFSKATAEEYVLGLENNGAVIRISRPVKKTPIFAISMGDTAVVREEEREDYIHALLRLYDQKKLYPLFIDQWFPITFIDDIATAIQKLIYFKLGGVFHVVSYDQTTPYLLAGEVLKRARHVEPDLKKTTFTEYIRSVALPRRYSQFMSMDGKYTSKKLELTPRTWKEIVELVFPGKHISSDTMILE